jgi:hypothetical protein
MIRGSVDEDMAAVGTGRRHTDPPDGGCHVPTTDTEATDTEGIMRFLSLRALFLLGFVVGMPVLAFPPVARWVDELLYGKAPSDFGLPPAAARPTQEVIQPQVAEQTSPARLEERDWAATNARSPGLDATAVQPPPLAPSPAFEPLPSSQVLAAEPAGTEPKIDDRTIARLQQLRQRLEDLGAQYVIVETLDGSGQYRFHCQMLIEPQSQYRRAFEATAADPLAAGEQVLRDVETWRTAAAEKRTRQQ